MRGSALLLLLVLPLPALTQEPTHPLDELTVTEYWAVYETLSVHDGVEEGAEFLYTGLNEPSKADVLAWRPGQSFGRQARVHLVQAHTGYEAVVDVAVGSLLAPSRTAMVMPS
jgi:Cu2+-containing amine oxidase